MSWLAVDCLDDARTATQSLLLPFDGRQWLRLAVISFFVGGVGSGGGASVAQNGAVPSPSSPTGPAFDPSGGAPPLLDGSGASLPAVPSLPVRVTTLVAIVGVSLLLAGFLYALASSVMEFVLVEGARTREVRLRRPFRQFLGPGLRLFGFRLGLLVLGVLFVGVPALVVLGGLSVSAVTLVVVPLLVLVALAGMFGLYLVDRITTDFVVPTMIAEGRSVTSAWGRLLPLVRAAWREFALYLGVRVALSVAASIAVGLVVGLVALVVAIPFVAVGGLVVVAFGLSPLTVVLVGVFVVVFVATLVVVSAVVQVPVVVYFRYYGLYVLGRLDERLDLVSVDATVN